jgi:hypothetical protein
MKLLLTTLKKTLFWSYERGSWQYDLMCVLILVFIFLAPNSVFHSHRSSAADTETARPIVVTSEEVGPIEPSRMEAELATKLAQLYGHEIAISRVEKVTDNSGAVKYLVYEK